MVRRLLLALLLLAGPAFGQALTDAQKADLAAKALVGLDYRSTALGFGNEPPGGGIIMHGDELWIDPIPFNDPTACVTAGTCVCYTSGSKLTLTEDTAVANQQAWCALASGSSCATGTLQRRWIPNSFGDAYRVRLYESDGSDTEVDQLDQITWYPMQFTSGRINLAQNPNTVSGRCNGACSFPFKVTGCYYTGKVITDVTTDVLRSIAALDCDDGEPIEWASGLPTCGTDDTGAGGGGTVTTVKEDGSAVGDPDIVSLDFLGADFDVSESPDTEANIAIAAAIARDAEVAAGYQPLDADLTAIAGLTTTAHGRGLLDDADAAASRTSIDAQQHDADLDDLADGSLSGSKVGSGISGTNVTTGTVDEARIDADITRDTEVPSLETDPGVPLLSLASYGDVCAGGEAVRRNAGDSANECYTPGSGGSSNSFETIDTSSGTDPVADSATDTLAMVGGAGVTVTGDATGDSITITTDSDESGFLSTCELTCGSSNAGQACVDSDSPLQYCDGAFGSALRYAAFGASDGDALVARDLNCSDCIDNAEIAAHAGTDLTEDLEEDFHGPEHAQGATDPLALEDLETFCASGQVIKSDGAGGAVCADDDTGGGGSSIVLDLADNGSNESTGITEIATTGDTNGVFSEPSADKLLIDASKDWPKADTADDLTCTNCIGPTEISDLTLGTDTAGNYAAGTAEAGAALTGDSASAFFSTGQIERARGGTGADTSGYGNGLIGSNSGGSTIDVDTLAELNASVGAALADGPHTTDTNAGTVCSGTLTYLDGEGTCDTYTLTGTTAQLVTFTGTGGGNKLLFLDANGNAIADGNLIYDPSNDGLTVRDFVIVDTESGDDDPAIGYRKGGTDEVVQVVTTNQWYLRNPNDTKRPLEVDIEGGAKLVVDESAPGYDMPMVTASPCIAPSDPTDSTGYAICYSAAQDCNFIDFNGDSDFNGLDGCIQFGTIVPADLANADFGDFTVASGVATINDDAVDGTDIAIASQATGDVLYYNGTDWVRLPIGTAGQVLEVNAGGTAPEWDTDDSGGGGATEEDVEDFVGGMVAGNTETNITVTYEDGDGTLDFVVPDASSGTKGVVQLTGDLGGSATSPSVVDDSHAHTGSTISGLDAADTTTGTFADARIDGAAEADEVHRTHATDCTGVTDGVANEICLELDSERLFSCQPTSGGCDTAGEWIATTVDASHVTSGTLADARVDGSLEADELVLAGDVDGTANGNDLDEAAVETELENVLDLPDLQGQIGDSQIAAGAVDGGAGGEIADGSVTADDLGTDSVSASELNATGVESELEAVLDLADLQGLVTTGQLPSGAALDTETCSGGACTVGTDDTVTLAQGTAPTPTAEGRIEWETDDDHLIVGDGTGQVEFVPAEDVSGDATMTDAGVVEVTQADALESNGSNCPTGQGAGGVDTVGAAEACIDPILHTELDTIGELGTQTGTSFQGTGSTFQMYGSGAGTNRCAFWNSSNQLVGDAGCSYNATTDVFSITGRLQITAGYLDVLRSVAGAPSVRFADESNNQFGIARFSAAGRFQVLDEANQLIAQMEDGNLFIQGTSPVLQFNVSGTPRNTVVGTATGYTCFSDNGGTHSDRACLYGGTDSTPYSYLKNGLQLFGPAGSTPDLKYVIDGTTEMFLRGFPDAWAVTTPGGQFPLVVRDGSPDEVEVNGLLDMVESEQRWLDNGNDLVLERLCALGYCATPGDASFVTHYDASTFGVTQETNFGPHTIDAAGGSNVVIGPDATSLSVLVPAVFASQFSGVGGHHDGQTSMGANATSGGTYLLCKDGLGGGGTDLCSLTSDGTQSKLAIGQLQADAIVNDTGLAAGTYTPTRSAEANLDSNVTPTEAQYMRVGNTLTVSGRVTGVDPTAQNTQTSFELTLPIASNLGAAEDCAGTAAAATIVGQVAEIYAVPANDTVKFEWRAGGAPYVVSHSISYSFTCQML